ncbi:hypothetical protein G7046_g723 [Stylonectria norvegica]|nr:hypothetical protein G7046_g723 [Stylonectria norvegica]
MATIQRRFMSTALRKEFLCILPDRPNVLSIRKQVKAAHYEGIQPLIAAGTLLIGGGMFHKHPVEGEPASFKGSMIVYAAKDAEEVREIISKDVYATSGVWDVEKAQIIPYVSAIREPMP